jgi:hypothetical protein
MNSCLSGDNTDNAMRLAMRVTADTEGEVQYPVWLYWSRDSALPCSLPF